MFIAVHLLFSRASKSLWFLLICLVLVFVLLPLLVWCVVLYSAVQCGALIRCGVLSHGVPVCCVKLRLLGCVVLCCVVLCCVVLCCVVLCCVVLCCVVLCCVVWCCVVLCCVVLCCVVLCCVVLRCVVLCCAVLCCAVVWYGAVWCGVPTALLPKGNGRDVLLIGIAKRAEVCACARSMWCVRTYAAAGLALACGGSSSKPPWDPLPLRLLVHL